MCVGADGRVVSCRFGYAIRNISPYEGDVYVEGESELYEFVLTGNGDDADRPCDGIMDDNGDGVVDEKDGLFVTCVSVTDAAENTVMILSLDLLKGYNTIIDSVRKAIVERVAAEGGAITADQIVISGSHTHSAPCTDNLSEVYLTKIRNQMTEAAVAAYLDRAPATIRRGSVDTMAATKEKYGTSYKMNFLRHYLVTATAESKPYLFGGAKTDTKYYIVGPNFGKTPTIGAAVSAFGTYDYGTMYTAGKYLVERIEHTEDADHTMGLLTFEFESGDRSELRVPENEFGILVVGDSGELTFQGTRYLGFARKRDNF